MYLWKQMFIFWHNRLCTKTRTMFFSLVVCIHIDRVSSDFVKQSDCERSNANWDGSTRMWTLFQSELRWIWYWSKFIYSVNGLFKSLLAVIEATKKCSITVITVTSKRKLMESYWVIGFFSGTITHFRTVRPEGNWIQGGVSGLLEHKMAEGL